MSEKSQASPDQLRSIPLLRGFSDDELNTLVQLFESVDTGSGGVLFSAGDAGTSLYFLTEGEVTLSQSGEETHKLRPPAVIGELGALSGHIRNSSAKADGAATVWRLRAAELQNLFKTEKDLGLSFYHNLMHIVYEKINRDQIRMTDMRGNIVRTQKAMKRMRDLLLDSQDTVVSEPLHETIQELIGQNRRANYRVTPPASLAATVRLDDGSQGPVVQVSRTHLSYHLNSTSTPSDKERVSAVLQLSGPEIPFTARVLRTRDTRVDVVFDLLLDEYSDVLEGYLTRVQMLDFLV